MRQLLLKARGIQVVELISMVFHRTGFAGPKNQKAGGPAVHGVKTTLA